MEEDYYFRGLVEDDWEEFNKFDEEVFRQDKLSKENFLTNLQLRKGFNLVMINKETKEFMGYFFIYIWNKIGEIQRWAIHPQHQKKEIAEALIDKIIEKLIEVGCESAQTYCLKNNKGIIGLYKGRGFERKRESTLVNFGAENLIAEPKGECRDVRYNEISLVSLRFNLNPELVQQYFGFGDQKILVYRIDDDNKGFCRFNTTTKLAQPFILREEDYLLDFITLISEYLEEDQNKNFTIQFDGQEELKEVLKKNLIKITMEFYLMQKELK